MDLKSAKADVKHMSGSLEGITDEIDDLERDIKGLEPALSKPTGRP